MIHKSIYRWALIIYLCLIPHINRIYAEEITVGTLKELEPPLKDIKSAYEKRYPENNVNFLFAKEKDLIELIKKKDSLIDVIILDDLKIIEKYAQEGYINSKTIKKLGEDKLCVVVKKNIAMRPFMLYPKSMIFQSLATANPSYSALGRYTKEALISLDTFNKVPKKLIYFENNNYIAETVAKGFYDGGIMYCSIAEKSFVNITDIINPEIHSKIIYSSGIKESRVYNTNVYFFNEFLTTPEAKKIYKKYNLK